MTGGEMKHYLMLKKRCDFLKERIAKLRKIGKKASFDEHEANALDWALETLGK